MHVYLVSPDAASSVADGGVMVRLADVVSPLRNREAALPVRRWSSGTRRIRRASRWCSARSWRWRRRSHPKPMPETYQC